MPDGGYEKIITAITDFSPNGTRGDEFYGDCPLCGGTNKFHINSLTGLWSCKAGKCQKEGNLYDFLDAWVEYCREEYGKQAPWEALAKDRGIPVAALENTGLTWNGEKWILPIYNPQGTPITLYHWPNGEKREMWLYAGLKHALYGVDRLGEFPKNSPIYLCEGIWDAAALENSLDGAAPVLATMGAGIFRSEWADFFARHSLIICYDNDQAGLKGAQKVTDHVANVSQDVKQIIWPDDLPAGYDVRDFFNNGGRLKDFIGLAGTPILSKEAKTAQSELFKSFGIVDFREDVMPVFRECLEITDDIEAAIRICYATVLSNQIPGDPLWFYVVSPPGGTKTEILRALSDIRNVTFISTLKPNTLVSGYKGGADPSLIPTLKNKTLVIKDLTTLLSAPQMVQSEVFGILRDAYDGESKYVYGNNVVRDFGGGIWFSVLAGVTPEVYATDMARLGERFLIYHTIKGAGYDDTHIVKRAAAGTGKESSTREKLAEISKEFLESKIEPHMIPEVPEVYRQRLVRLAQLTAKLRGSVKRSNRDNHILLYPPQHEVGSRLVKQLIRLAQCLSLLEPGMAFNERVYGIVKRVALDSCNSFNLQLVEDMIKLKRPVSRDELSDRTNLPYETVRLCLDNMRRLDALENVNGLTYKGRNIPHYKPSRMVEIFWREAAISTTNGFFKHKEKELKPLRFSRLIKERG